MADHTPGPWSMTRTGNDITITGPEDDQWVADVVRSIVAEDGEQEANARLIASAPALKQQRDDLLAALESVLPIAAENVDEDAILLVTEADHDDHRVRLDAIQQARAATAAAKAVA